jgi:hypothetical protein
MRASLKTACKLMWIMMLPAAAAWGADQCYYSPVDSVLYVQFMDGEFTFRFTDGGQTAEQAGRETPGLICTSEPVPGKIFCMPFISPGNGERLYVSEDWGQSWTLIPGSFRGDMYYLTGRPGSRPGESFLMNEGWVYFTRDSWMTRDSIYANQDSPYVLAYKLFFEGGHLLGGGLSNNVCFSSDTGRTWSDLHQVAADLPRPMDTGATDELWGIGRYPTLTNFVCVIRDSGRRIDTVFSLPTVLHYQTVVSTDLPGEAYAVADSFYWVSIPPTAEVKIYHFREYGARVDSFHHLLRYSGVTSRATPQDFAVQVFPNPFNITTQIEFTLPTTQRVSLRLYDALGREVAVLMNEIQTAGKHGMMFDASGLTSGVYLCRLEAGTMMQTRKMVLIK